MAVVIQATGPYGPYDILDDVDVSFAGDPATSCSPGDHLFGSIVFACEWDDGLADKTTVTASFLGLGATDTLTVM